MKHFGRIILPDSTETVAKLVCKYFHGDTKIKIKTKTIRITLYAAQYLTK